MTLKSDWSAHGVDPAVARLWMAHGGDHHGPRVETVTMPMAKFSGFVKALRAATARPLDSPTVPQDEPIIALANQGGAGVSIKPIFAWYDMWVGAFWDAAKRRLYVFPVPMLGVVIQFTPKENGNG